MNVRNPLGVPTGTNPSVSPYARGISAGQPEPSVPVGTPAADLRFLAWRGDPDTALRAETDAVQRAIATALDDCRVHLGPVTTARLAARLTELLDLDRQQRHQRRRDRAADALFIDQATHERGRDD